MKRSFISALALSLCLSFSAVAFAEENGINVNTATLEELTAVPGLNAELAKSIIQYREEMGDFMSIDELADVPGMDKNALDQAKQNLRVDAISGAECNC
ncbi:helix-hairpin-helix domain-containing protein [Mailhella sp.]|uniref:helix-hairpin-helix domain-containing protein n=1 Tax=Mailhella sp. TaxID=1981029 RepID=UPI003AB11882